MRRRFPNVPGEHGAGQGAAPGRASPGCGERGCHGGAALLRCGDTGTRGHGASPAEAGAAAGLSPAAPEPPAPRPRRGRSGAVPGRAGMAGLPGASRARSASPGSPPALDGSFLVSPLGWLMCAQAVSTGEGARRGGRASPAPGLFFSSKQPGFSWAAAPTPSPLSNPINPHP